MYPIVELTIDRIDGCDVGNCAPGRIANPDAIARAILTLVGGDGSHATAGAPAGAGRLLFN